MAWRRAFESSAGVVAGMGVLVAASLLWIVGAGAATRYAADTAAQLVRPALYVDAVEGKLPKPSPRTVAP